MVQYDRHIRFEFDVQRSMHIALYIHFPHFLDLAKLRPSNFIDLKLLTWKIPSLVGGLALYSPLWSNISYKV